MPSYRGDQVRVLSIDLLHSVSLPYDNVVPYANARACLRSHQLQLITGFGNNGNLVLLLPSSCCSLSFGKCLCNRQHQLTMLSVASMKRHISLYVRMKNEDDRLQKVPSLQNRVSLKMMVVFPEGGAFFG